jgi:KaiC/GvpD/RAD55 family RecA-like ATPase
VRRSNVDGGTEGRNMTPSEDSAIADATAADVTDGSRPGGSRSVSTGIGPLDDRTGGLEAGGLHLLSAPPIPARTAAVAQFLQAGLDEGDRVALVTRTRPDRTFDAARRFGCDLEGAWRDGRLRLLGFRGDYEVRLRRAASPEEVYLELASLLGPPPARIAFDPGTVLWEGRGEGGAASAFVDFVDGLPATVLATTTRELGGDQPLSSELVSQAAAGVFELREEGGGFLRLSVRSLDGGRPAQPDVTLALEEGQGLVAPEGRPARRASDPATRDGGDLLRLQLDGPLAEELESWLRDSYPVARAGDPLDLVSRLQTDEPYALVLVSLGRERLDEGLKACRVCRRLRPGLPVVVVSDDPVRASDRAALLRAGADECMTGGVNVEELASRLELARSRAGTHPGAGDDGRAIDAADGGPSTDAPGASGGRGAAAGEAGVDGGPPAPLDEAAFHDALRERLSGSGARVFTVVRFAAEEPAGLARELAGLVRSEDGDVAGVLAGRAAAWLSDTVPSEAEAFLRRVGVAVEDAVEVAPDGTEVLGSARDADRLRELVE